VRAADNAVRKYRVYGYCTRGLSLVCPSADRTEAKGKPAIRHPAFAGCWQKCCLG